MTNNTQIVRDWLAIISEGAPGGWMNAARHLISDDMEWELIGSTPVSGTHRGLAAIQRDFFDVCNTGDGRGSGTQGLDPTFNRTFHVSGVHGLDDGRVVAFCRAEGQGRNRVPYDQVYCWIVTVEDGKVRRLVEFCDTAIIEQAMFDKALVPAESVGHADSAVGP